MKEISSTENHSGHFSNLMSVKTDEELINILKKRKYYQPEAAKAAVLEAIERGIIHSEQDLFAEKFNTIQQKPGLFPDIENPAIKEKLKKSISRSLILVGAIPLVWCVSHWNSNVLTQNLLVLLYSFAWIGIAFGLLKTKNLWFGYGLLVLLVPGLLFLTRMLLENQFLKVYEIVVPAVLSLLIVYGVAYLRKLNR